MAEQQQQQQQDYAGAAAAAATAAAMALAASVPQQTQKFTSADHAFFDEGLVQLGLDSNPSVWIQNGWTNKSRSMIKVHMDFLLRNASLGDTSKIPQDCNHQAYLATQLLLDICKPRGSVDDYMLNKLIQNLKLLTLTYQHIKQVDCKPLCMEWWNTNYKWKEAFEYQKHNRHVVRWIENHPPDCIKHRFQGAHYGIYEHAYKSGIMVSVIAKVPITDGRFHSIGHKEVIQLLVDCCGINPRLASALSAVGDVMVSDYHGNGLYDVLKYKALYLKLAASRLDAIAVLMDEIPMLQSSQGRDDISWGAEMSQSNRPPNKHQIAVHKKQQQQVCIQGPYGPIDLSKFEKQSVGSVQAMATSNVSFEQVDQLAELAKEVKASRCWLEAKACK